MVVLTYVIYLLKYLCKQKMTYMEELLLLNDSLFAEINACITKGDFLDVDLEMTIDETKVCDMNDIMKAVQTVMIQKMLSVNDADLEVLKGEEGWEKAAEKYNRDGLDSEILMPLRLYFMKKLAMDSGHNILDKELGIRKGFIIVMKINPHEN